VKYYEVPAMSDVPSTRPESLPDHIAYRCATTSRVRIDRLPTTLEEIRECGDALAVLYAKQEESS
jgi:hypothetical protein